MTADRAYGRKDTAAPLRAARVCCRDLASAGPAASPVCSSPWPSRRSYGLCSLRSTHCCASAAITLRWPCLKASGTGQCEWGRRAGPGMKGGVRLGSEERILGPPQHRVPLSSPSVSLGLGVHRGVQHSGRWICGSVRLLSWGSH